MIKIPANISDSNPVSLIFQRGLIKDCAAGVEGVSDKLCVAIPTFLSKPGLVRRKPTQTTSTTTWCPAILFDPLWRWSSTRGVRQRKITNVLPICCRKLPLSFSSPTQTLQARQLKGQRNQHPDPRGSGNLVKQYNSKRSRFSSLNQKALRRSHAFHGLQQRCGNTIQYYTHSQLQILTPCLEVFVST